MATTLAIFNFWPVTFDFPKEFHDLPLKNVANFSWPIFVQLGQPSWTIEVFPNDLACLASVKAGQANWPLLYTLKDIVVGLFRAYYSTKQSIYLRYILPKCHSQSQPGAAASHAG